MPQRCGRADAGIGQGGLGARSLKVPDEILERIRRQVGPTDDRHRRLRDEADRCECRLRIVGKLAIESGRGRESHVIDQQGVAVRVGAHRAAGADSAASAAGVLDRDLLAENFRHGLRGDARDRIGRPARGRGDDDVDRPRRVVLRRGGADHGPKRRGDREQTHRVSSRGACFGAYDISNHWAANPPLS